MFLAIVSMSVRFLSSSKHFDLNFCKAALNNLVFNDRFYLSFFVATHGFRENYFDYY